MKENSHPIEIQILRFLQGEANETDVKMLKEWISQKEENLKLYLEWTELWELSEMAGSDLDKKQSAAWARLSLVLDKQTAEQKQSPRINFPGFLRIAAMLILAVGLTWILSHKLQTTLPVEDELTRIITPLGSRTHVILPDSSQAWLNAGSSLKYSSVFTQKKRQVYLEGEAFFDVVPDEKRMFEVLTSDVTVQVYGTSFNVKSYEEEGTIETTLIEGKVSLVRNSETSGRKQKKVHLVPNQKATFIKKEGRIALAEIMEETNSASEQILKSGNILIFNQVDVEEVASWKTGQLVINSESLIDLSTKLSRKYDVEFVFEDEGLKKFKFSGILEDESLEQVLFAMQLTAPINYTIEGKVVYLKVLPGVITDN